MHWQLCRKGSETPPQRHRTLRMEEVCPMDGSWEGGHVRHDTDNGYNSITITTT
jgi:hypothetical protein